MSIASHPNLVAHMLQWLHSYQEIRTGIWHSLLCLTPQLYDAFPWLMHHLPGPHQEVFAYNDFMHRLVMKEVQAHERHSTGDPQDLIDFYLAQITKVSFCLSHSLPSLSSMPTTNICCSKNCQRIFTCTLYLCSTEGVWFGGLLTHHLLSNNDSFCVSGEIFEIIYFIVFLWIYPTD